MTNTVDKMWDVEYNEKKFAFDSGNKASVGSGNDSLVAAQREER